MKYFFDTEFIELPGPGGIQLVSIGVVCMETDHTFYAESIQWDPRTVDQWIKDNVISKLKYYGRYGFMEK